MKNIKSGLLLILVFFLFWGPRFFFLDFFYFFSFLFSALFVANLLLNKITFFREGLTFVFLLIPCLAYNLIIAFYYDFQELNLVYEILKAVLMTFSAHYIVNFFYKQSYNPNRLFIQMLYYATVLNSFTVLLTQFSPVVKEKVLPMLNFKMASSWEVISGLRSTDWSMGGGTALSIVLFFIATASFQYKKHIVFFYEGFIIIIFATFFSGRTGFYLMILFSAFIVIKHYFSLFTSTRMNFNRTLIIRLMVYPLIIIFLGTQLANAIDWSIINDKVLPWAFEAFYAYGSSGKAESQTTDILFNDFYFLPATFLEQLFGNGNFEVESDVGFIKIIHASGIFGLILLLLPFFYLIYSGFKQKNKSVETKLFLFYIVLIFFINFKELFLMNSRTGFLILMTFYFLMLYNKKAEIGGKLNLSLN